MILVDTYCKRIFKMCSTLWSHSFWLETRPILSKKNKVRGREGERERETSHLQRWSRGQKPPTTLCSLGCIFDSKSSVWNMSHKLTGFVLNCFQMKYGGHGYSHILLNVVPKMISKGISQQAIDKILVDNPRQWLQF